MKMKRKVIYFTVFLAMILLCACSNGSGLAENSVPESLIGKWRCLDEAPDSEEGYGFYALRIEEDGEFSLYDQDAGNPGIAGVMNGEQDSKSGSVAVDCNTDDFDPPNIWEMKEMDKLEFQVLENGQIKLGYNGKWLTFEQDKGEADEE